MKALRIAALVCTLFAGAVPAAVAQDREDSALEQSIDARQRVAGGEKVLADGHVDVGPRFVDGRWTLMIHDDAAKAATGGESVWRHADRTVLAVGDAAKLRAPDDRAYDFLHAAPGSDVWVVPQTQDPEVVWIGWNTQDPSVMEAIDRGATMTLTGVQGPGDLVVYLQSGSFAAPRVLWDSTARPRPVWVDVNTHSHANWVFTRPGVYLVRVRVEAELIDGRTVSDTRDLRFAVGAGTSPRDALAADWSGGAEEDAGAAATSGASADEPPAEEAGGLSGAAVAAIVVVAALLAGGGALVVVRGNRAKRQARA